jgi:hypothetical protein
VREICSTPLETACHLGKMDIQAMNLNYGFKRIVLRYSAFVKQ